jgi:uncharacterized protein (DUF433 family)
MGGAILAAIRLPTEYPEAWMATNERIEINPEIVMGKPVVRGTRIPVELILRKLGEGATEAELLDAYPRLTREDLLAAKLFAADVVAHETHTDRVSCSPWPKVRSD